MDVKYKDVEAFPDKHIDITFFNGSIRNSEQEHMAKVLRAKI
jgi:F420-non-reducing hydrogenase small subunit